MIFTELDRNYWKGDYLRFKDEGKVSRTAKTGWWSVWSRHDGTVLGAVRWKVTWRAYVYFPLPNNLYDKQCLRELADFCEYVTAVHKERL